MSTLTISAIQTNLHWEDKSANLQMLEQKISSIKEKTEIVVLPEMFSTGFSMKTETLAETMEGETLQWMKRIAAEKKIILTGSFICRGAESDLVDKTVQAAESDRADKTVQAAESDRADKTVQTAESDLTDKTVQAAESDLADKTVQAASSGPTRYYNRLIWMQPNGQYGVYDKRHCFAFAGEDEHYTAGTKRLIASVKGWKINLLICYDLRFPVWARQTPGDAAEYDVLIYVANWPERRIHAWKTLLQARAIENQCYVVGTNRVGDDGNNIHYSGESMIVDPLGEVLYTKKEEEDIFTITLDKTHLQTVRDKFPFLRDADDFKMITDR